MLQNNPTNKNLNIREIVHNSANAETKKHQHTSNVRVRRKGNRSSSKSVGATSAFISQTGLESASSTSSSKCPNAKQLTYVRSHLERLQGVTLNLRSEMNELRSKVKIDLQDTLLCDEYNNMCESIINTLRKEEIKQMKDKQDFTNQQSPRKMPKPLPPPRISSAVCSWQRSTGEQQQRDSQSDFQPIETTKTTNVQKNQQILEISSVASSQSGRQWRRPGEQQIESQSDFQSTETTTNFAKNQQILGVSPGDSLWRRSGEDENSQSDFQPTTETTTTTNFPKNQQTLDSMILRRVEFDKQYERLLHMEEKRNIKKQQSIKNVVNGFEVNPITDDVSESASDTFS